MKIKARRDLGLFAAACAGLLSVSVMTDTAAAQQQDTAKKEETLKPPTPSKPDDPPAIWNYLTMATLIGMVALAALLPSKRGHQD
jgi:hypothetical protein